MNDNNKSYYVCCGEENSMIGMSKYYKETCGFEAVHDESKWITFCFDDAKEIALRYGWGIMKVE